MAEKISTEFRLMKPYIAKEVDKTMLRRGLTAPTTAQATPATPPGGWTFDDGSDFDDGLFFDP